MTSRSTDDVRRYPLDEEQMAAVQQFASALTVSYIDWLSYFEERFYSVGFTLAFFRVLAEPADTKASLALYLENEAKVSRSTAERMIRDAEEAGHLVAKDNPKGRGKCVYLGDALFNHCVEYVRRRVDVTVGDEAWGKAMASIKVD